MLRQASTAQGTLTTNYPPYNIYRDGDNYRVEIAVAGFKRSDIDIELTENMLTVTGKIEQKGETVDVIHQGIASREFSRSFVLGENIIVKGADLQDGMLFIDMVHIVPEEKKPRKIEIGLSENKPELLNE
jgi:molecular chaperone IbpA